MALANSRRAVFIDKDGTLLENVPYNVNPALMRFAPGAAECLRLLSTARYLIFVVTNQSGVARGIFPESALLDVRDALRDRMSDWGARLTGFYYCPHADSTEADACDCRKPEPGLLYRAASDHRIDLARSWFVGDIMNDVEAGRRAGCRTVLVKPARQPHERSEWQAPELVVEDLAEAARMILACDGVQLTRLPVAEEVPA